MLIQKFILSWFIWILCLQLSSAQLLNQPPTYKLQAAPEPGMPLSIDPSQLISISPDTTSFETVWSAPVKVIVYLEGGCSMCGVRFGGWKAIIDEKFSKWDVPVLVIAYDPSLPSLSFTALDNVQYNYPLFFDRLNSFFIENKLSADPNFHAFLLDGDNQIRIIGSPVENPKLLSDYRREIKRIRKEVKRIKLTPTSLSLF